MIKEPPASVFILQDAPGRQWRAALVWHPRLECWLPAGGNVEHGETTAEAAAREALEETGLNIQLVPGAYRAAPRWVPAFASPRTLMGGGDAGQCRQPHSSIQSGHGPG